MTSYIFLTNHPEQEAINFHDEHKSNSVLFVREELNIEMARQIIDEAYISSDGGKFILIASNSFNIYAQNSLLKVLEEPPKGVIFIIFSKSKSLLLPTIRSRMPIVNHLVKHRMPNFEINIANLNLEQVYQFLKDLNNGTNRTISVDDLKVQIQSLYLDCISYGISFNDNETDIFCEALQWASNGERAHNIFSVLLLMVLRKVKHKKLNRG